MARERMPFWPFTREALDEDLRAAGLRGVGSSDAARYHVITRRDG